MYVRPGYLLNIDGQNKRRKKQRKILFVLGLTWLALIFTGVASIGSFEKDVKIETENPDEKEAISFNQTPISVFDEFYDTKIRTYDEIGKGENLLMALKRLDVSAAMAQKFATAVGKEINLLALQPGDALMVESHAQKIQVASLGNITTNTNPLLEVRALEFFSSDKYGVAYKIRAEIEPEIGGNVSVTVDKPSIFKEHTQLTGTVVNNIYESIVKNGGDAQLVNNFSDIFAWQFDFYKDTREGDFFQMVTERNVVQGRFIGFGRVLAAEYVNGGKFLRAFYYESNDGQVAGYYDEEGQSLKNAFLKAPIKLASIGSKFGMRFHPIQKIMKPHNGVDYGAAQGTPFAAVANGTVINAGYSRFNGNWVRIRHLNGYETEYLHASRLVKGIRLGARVEQGQVIGFVGSTGLASGPHLHFGMKHRGKYVNPSTQRFAKSPGVPADYLGEFRQIIKPMVLALNNQGPKSNPILALN